MEPVALISVQEVSLIGFKLSETIMKCFVNKNIFNGVVKLNVFGQRKKKDPFESRRSGNTGSPVFSPHTSRGLELADSYKECFTSLVLTSLAAFYELLSLILISRVVFMTALDRNQNQTWSSNGFVRWRSLERFRKAGKKNKSKKKVPRYDVRKQGEYRPAYNAVRSSRNFTLFCKDVRRMMLLWAEEVGHNPEVKPNFWTQSG